MNKENPTSCPIVATSPNAQCGDNIEMKDACWSPGSLDVDCFREDIGESYESFDRKRSLMKYQYQSKVIKVIL